MTTIREMKKFLPVAGVVFAAIVAMAGAEHEALAAKPKTVHWKDQWHGSSWWINEHWRSTKEIDKILRAVDAWGIPVDGDPVGSVYDNPADFMPMMFSQSVMDDHMNTLAHRGVPELQYVSDLWRVEHTDNPADGIVFHWLEDVVRTTDGFEHSLMGPVSFTMSLHAVLPTGVVGEQDYVFIATLPAHGVLFQVLDPAAGIMSPQVFSNGEPLEFEFTVTIPEPGAMFALGALGLAGVVRRGRRS